VESAESTGDIRVVRAAGGEAVLERAGRALDSRRQPVESAERQAAETPGASTVVVGLGSGYLAEALVRRPVAVTAIVESDPAIVRAAMEARDLRSLLGTVPVVLTEHLRSRVELARLRRHARSLAVHAPSTTASRDLAALVAGWDKIPVATRRPRVLVVGPIYGASLGVATATVRACRACGASTKYFDATPFDAAQTALNQLDIPSAHRGQLVGGLVDVLGEGVVSVARKWRPDLVFAMAQAPLTAGALRRLSELGAATAFWFVENSRILTYWSDFARHYDWFYAIQPGAFIDRLADLGSPHPRYLPMACNPDVHRPVELSVDEQAHYGSAVSFAGTPYLNRLGVFPSLVDFDLRIWGPGWERSALASRVPEGGERFSTDEMVKIFCATQVNLNLHSASHVTGLDPEPDYVNPRTFELAACGAFQLVDARAPLPALFSAEEVVSFSSVAQLREQVGYYLANKDERLAIAALSRRRALREHTYRHRIASVLEDTLAPELVAAAGDEVPEESLPDAIARYEREAPTMGRAEALARIVREVEDSWAAQ
jgi:spore maturation protein CgeB